MTSAYHCGNCPFSVSPQLGIIACENNPLGEYRVLTKGEMNAHYEMGCLSHPLAQAAMREEGAKQERERVFSFIRDFVATHVPDGGCPFGKMNSEECLDVRDGQCEICIIDHAIESLRGQYESKGEPECGACTGPDPLDVLDKFYERMNVAHRHNSSSYGEGLLDGIDLSMTEIKNELRRRVKK